MATTKELTLQEVHHLLAQSDPQNLYHLGSLFQEHSRRMWDFKNEGGTLFQSDRLQNSKDYLAQKVLEFLQIG